MSLAAAAATADPEAIVLDADDGLIGAMSLEVAGGEIVAVNSVVNPEKLRHLGRVGDMLGMLRRDR